MQEERKMILKMIEDGKITAEEGVSLLKELGETEKKEPKREANTYLSNDVDWENGHDYRGKYSQPSFTNRFTDFIEQAVQKIKEFDLDLNFGNSVEIDHIFHHRDSNISRVDIAVENGSVNFVPWDENDVRVECKVKVYREKEVEAARKYFLEEVSFNVTDDKLRFKSREKSLKINAIVYIPRKDFEEVKLYTFNGQLNGDVIEAARFEAKTVNGRISIDKLSGSKVTLETVNGSITVNKLAAEKVEAKTVHGTIHLPVTGGEADVETLNGTIKYKLTEKVKSKAYLKTTTGSIEITIPSEMKTEGEFKTVVGGFTCDLPKMEVLDEKKDIVNKFVTFVSNKGIEPVFYVEAEARTGSILIQN
ncbi:DUF4097 family beta strand repeat-containing protein [Anaerobacillus isosaccharinicus]|uniref:DUF4097 domain-containing protein n=1 Tax=Anaerobacillus isosaccharinicus TaxID=1532552 RepID=A0A1S2MFD5_9BACI|nr:DUF4097 domain-containing protein [Anaerobacillus isosaccharinicus]MBA5584656.1 DUF4097 domain-containing protein [Anaerobacillus isosaccharinicus]QOY36970.1 DUF4097 domain-containing protein [Anaerobacillus isosaccharinicus]